MWALALDVLVAVLLAVTIVYALLLNRRLRGLRRDRAELERVAGHFEGAIGRAEKGLANITAATDHFQAERAEAGRLQDDLRFLIERAEGVADRLDAGVRAASRLAVSGAGAPARPAGPSRGAGASPRCRPRGRRGARHRASGSARGPERERARAARRARHRPVGATAMAKLSGREFRFLPVVIAVAALALIVKAELVMSRLPLLLAGTVAIADAQAADPAAVTGTRPAGGGADMEAAGADAPAAPDPPGGGGDGDAGGPGSDAVRGAGETAVTTPGRGMPADGSPASADGAPTTFSEAEVEVLQQLAARRKTLDEREAELGRQTALIEAAEARIETRIQELRDLRATLEQLVAVYEQQEDAKVRSLVKIYENMKPKDAAKIFEALEMDTLLLVAERMKERKLAPIMAEMNPGKAREMTVELSRLRRIPDVPPPPSAGPDGETAG